MSWAVRTLPFFRFDWPPSVWRRALTLLLLVFVPVKMLLFVLAPAVCWAFIHVLDLCVHDRQSRLKQEWARWAMAWGTWFMLVACGFWSTSVQHLSSEQLTRLLRSHNNNSSSSSEQEDQGSVDPAPTTSTSLRIPPVHRGRRGRTVSIRDELRSAMQRSQAPLIAPDGPLFRHWHRHDHAEAAATTTLIGTAHMGSFDDDSTWSSPTIVSNHLSWLDVLLIMAYLHSPAFVAKSSVRHIPMIGYFFQWMGGVCTGAAAAGPGADSGAAAAASTGDSTSTSTSTSTSLTQGQKRGSVVTRTGADTSGGESGSAAAGAAAGLDASAAAGRAGLQHSTSQIIKEYQLRFAAEMQATASQLNEEHSNSSSSSWDERRAHADETRMRMAPLAIFPEGTTSNGAYLLRFRTGAFLSGQPVRIVAIRFRWKYFNPSWETFPFIPHWCATFTQLYNTAELLVLPPYIPSQQERENPKLFARNVESILSFVLGVPVHDAGRLDKKQFHRQVCKSHAARGDMHLTERERKEQQQRLSLAQSSSSSSEAEPQIQDCLADRLLAASASASASGRDHRAGSAGAGAVGMHEDDVSWRMSVQWFFGCGGHPSAVQEAVLRNEEEAADSEAEEEEEEVKNAATFT